MSARPIYSLRVPEVWNALETSPSGLSEGEVQARLSLYGQNLLRRQEKKSTAERFFRYMLHPSALVLLMVGLAGLLVRDVILALIIWSIVLVNSAFSFWREHRAEQAIDKLRLILPSFAHVVREGIEHSIPASEVVPGDLMVLAEGDNIAADARVIEEYGLRTNNATLTGEAIPARKLADPSHQEGLSELDRPNLIFAGTSVASGTGRAVVYRHRHVHRVRAHRPPDPDHPGGAHSLPEGIEPPEPQDRLDRADDRGHRGLGGLFPLGFPLKEVTLLAFGIIVAVIPEGLTATLTLSLAAAVQRLAGKGVLAKRLSTVERLGQVSVICTDKSGTLTQNQMTVRDVWVARQKLRLSGTGYEPEGEFTPAPAGKAWEPDLPRAAGGGGAVQQRPPQPAVRGASRLDQPGRSDRGRAEGGRSERRPLAGAAGAAPAARARDPLRRAPQAHDHRPPRTGGRAGLRQRRPAGSAAALQPCPDPRPAGAAHRGTARGDPGRQR